MALTIQTTQGRVDMYLQNFSNPRYIDIMTIQYIQADGDELAYILNKFSGIPKLRDYEVSGLDHVPVARVMLWFGDDAKFIVANL